MEKAYKFRIYPNKTQRELISKTFGCCRFVYNKYLAKRIELYEENKGAFSYVQCANDMNTVGVERFNDMQGKYVRVATKSWGDTVKIVGNIIKDQSEEKEE